MTATDTLRALLDERGVEWGEALTDLSRQTHWSTERNWCAFTEWNDAVNIADTLTVYHVSPEQAVEATLGRGTCHIVKTWSDSDYVDGWRYRCSECMCFIPVNERNPETGDVISAANYCPNCGRRVEE